MFWSVKPISLQNEKAVVIAHFLDFESKMLRFSDLKLHKIFRVISGKRFFVSKFFKIEGLKWLFWEYVCQNISKIMA